MHLGDPQGWGKIHPRYQALREGTRAGERQSKDAWRFRIHTDYKRYDIIS
jgi:hypothetical protein